MIYSEYLVKMYVLWCLVWTVIALLSHSVDIFKYKFKTYLFSLFVFLF